MFFSLKFFVYNEQQKATLLLPLFNLVIKQKIMRFLNMMKIGIVKFLNYSCIFKFLEN